MTIAKLPTLAQMDAERRGKPIPKGVTRIARKVEADKASEKDAAAFRRAVWARDKVCRCCGLKVIKTLALVPNRGEVHHLVRRSKAKALLTDRRNGILLCLEPCHRRVTTHDLVIVGHAVEMFTLEGNRYLNADKPSLKFIRANVKKRIVERTSSHGA